MSHRKPTDQVAALAELGLLASSLVHELRQPLFAARGTLQLAPVDGPARTSIDEALRHLGHAAALLDHYAALGRSAEPAAMVDVSERVEVALGLVRGTARVAGVSLACQLADRGALVRARPAGVTQVAANLVRNAIEAAPQDGRGEVLVGVAVGDGRVTLQVEDNGQGVPASVADRVGEPWVSTKGASGTGLGLYLCVRLVREAGGGLEVGRSGRGGACVTAWWPAAGAV